MYIILAIIMLLRGFSDAHHDASASRRSPSTASEGYLPPHHYDQIFTAHGVIMIFFVAMPFVTGLMNYVVPLQIGARDVSFPFLNNFSFWMTTAGAIIIMMSLFVGEFARTGWLAYPPLSGVGLQSRRRRRLLHLGPAGRGYRNDAIGHQPDRHHRQDARPGHDLHEDAGLHLDVALHQHPDRRELPDPDRDARAADARPLRRHELLHQRPRRQSDDVCQPHLDLGSPGSLHPRSCRPSASSRKSSPPSAASACSATPRWSTPPA